MGVLAAVLADARHVALDVAGLQGALVERRVEELDQLVVAAHQTLLDRVHRRSGPRRVRDAGDHRPGLRDRVDLAFVVLGRAEGRAVVEVRPAVPGAVPGVRLQGRPQRLGPLPAPGSHRAASPRRSASVANAFSTVTKNQPFQTLSPLPSAPTRFMPSFQSPVPIRGNPCGPSR